MIYMNNYSIIGMKLTAPIIVEGIETDYTVTTDGRVISNNYNHTGKPKVLKPGLSKGYLLVRINVGNHLRTQGVHVLVAKAFVKNDDPEHKTQVNHIDGNPLNNNVTNLEWVTPQENVVHSVLTGIKGVSKGEQNGMSKITKDKVLEIASLIQQSRLSIKEIAYKTDTPYSTVQHVLYQDRWKRVIGNMDFTMYSFSKAKNCGEYNPHKHFTSNDIEFLCQILESESLKSESEWMNILDIALDYNISVLVILDVIKRKRWTEISDKYTFYERMNKMDYLIIDLPSTRPKKLCYNDEI